MCVHVDIIQHSIGKKMKSFMELVFFYLTQILSFRGSNPGCQVGKYLYLLIHCDGYCLKSIWQNLRSPGRRISGCAYGISLVVLTASCGWCHPQGRDPRLYKNGKWELSSSMCAFMHSLFSASCQEKQCNQVLGAPATTTSSYDGLYPSAEINPPSLKLLLSE